MALNGNHVFEDLNEIKCAIVEKNCTEARVAFLKDVLEHNGYTVIIVNSPPPKAAKTSNPDEPIPELPQTFTVGVTVTSFSPIKTIINRELQTKDGKVLSMDYWKQRQEKDWYWSK
ncbi:MAG: hypothetical protein ACOVP1_13935 [Bacteroidia bacterium]